MELAVEAAETGNANAITDAASGTAMAQAALQAAGLNVRINASSVSDKEAAQVWRDALRELETQAETLQERLHDACLDTLFYWVKALKERGGITL